MAHKATPPNDRPPLKESNMNVQTYFNVFRKMTPEQRNNFNAIKSHPIIGEFADLNVSAGIEDFDEFGSWDAELELLEDGVLVTGAMGSSGYGNTYAVKFDWYGEVVSWKNVKDATRQIAEEKVKAYEDHLNMFCVEIFEFASNSEGKEILQDLIGEPCTKLFSFY